MFGIGKWVHNKVVDSQMAEATRYLETLKGAGQGEIDMFASMVMLWRSFYLKRGIDFENIIHLASTDPHFNLGLVKTIKELQKSGALSSAAGLMLWLHTARSALFPELRYTAKRMWEQLERCGPEGYELAKELCEKQNLSYSDTFLSRPFQLED